MKNIFLVVFILTLTKAQFALSAQAPNFNLQAGTGSVARGEADILLPILSNKNSIFYTDFNAQYADDKSRYGGVGIGGRKIFGDKIFGVYGFIDRSKTAVNSQEDNWGILNFGAEMITQKIDMRFNFYAPTSSRKKEKYNNYDVVRRVVDTNFTDNVTDMQKQEVPYGGDVSVGYKINFLDAKLHSGAYYYKYSYNEFHDIIGGVAGASLPIAKHVYLRFDGSYDNFKKTSGLASLVFNFGSDIKKSPLENRLTDKVQRHIGTIHNGSGTIAKTKQTQSVVYDDTGVLVCGAAGGIRPLVC